MARKRAKIESDMFAPTGDAKRPEVQAEQIDLDKGKTVRLGIGLKEGEVNALDEIAESTGFSRHALMRYAVRYFIKQHHAGEIELSEAPPPPPKHKPLHMP